MKNKFLISGALGFLLTVLLAAAAPVRGDDVDQRIRSLEDELARLKSEQTQVKAEQIELRKQATAAEAALPSFSYRPGSGMLIEAADKAWSFRFTLESHFRLLFESGLTEAGRETGGVMGRRFRPFFYYCVNDCLYEVDLTASVPVTPRIRRTQVPARFCSAVYYGSTEKLNPWLATLYLAMDDPSLFTDSFLFPRSRKLPNCRCDP